MKNKIKIRVYDDFDLFITYLVNNNIFYNSLVRCNNCCSLNIDYSDYKKISRRFNTNIIKYYGRNGIIMYIKNNKHIMLSVIVSLMLLNLLTHTIFDIRINTDDEELKNTLLNSLNNYGISKYKHKKSFDEIYNIKQKILLDNKDILEWLEIKEKGCVYEIYLTKRIKNNDAILDDSPNSIIAKKDGLIKHITSSSGVIKVDINDYVKKGDILISGNIIKNEELVTRVKSNGEVYAEVWYIVKVNIPFNYIEYIETGKTINRYYLEMFNKEFTIIGKYDSNNMISNKKLLLEKPYLFFKLYKETMKEYKYKEYNMNYNTAYNEAIKRSENQIKNRLNDGEYIISKKVLKKETNRSKMYVEVFFKVYENIGVTSNIEDIGEINANSNQRSN